MRILIIPSILTLILGSQALSQQHAFNCTLNDDETESLQQNNVMERWEFKVDRKTKKKVFNAVYRYDENGCPNEHTWRDTTNSNGTYRLNEWNYDENGKLLAYKVGMFDQDSVLGYLFNETYNYNFAGHLSNYRKDIYESEMAQTVEKMGYNYSGTGKNAEVIYSKLIVHKDTIANNEIKYSSDGMPIQLTVNSYFPKSISDYRRYNDKGLPVEYIRYEKRRMVQHKIYSYKYDSEGMMLQETIKDTMLNTTAIKKYEKEKITLTVKDGKGILIKTTVFPNTPPISVKYPALTLDKTPKTQAPPVMRDDMSRKEKFDTKKNKIVQTYFGQTREGMITEMFNPQGLLIEKAIGEGDVFLSYEYAFY